MPEHTEEGRLHVLRSTRLLDTSPELAFDRLTRLTSGLLHAPTALVSLVDERRQFFKSSFGLAEPWSSRRETPLSHSFCLSAVRGRAPLVVNDARADPAFCDNLAVRDLHVVAYAGVPLMIADEAIGALCVLDGVPRAWSPIEIGVLEDLAESVVSEIELRLATRAAEEQGGLLSALLESLGDAVLATDMSNTFLVVNAAARKIFAEGAIAGQPLPKDWSSQHGARRADGSAMPSEEGALVRARHGKDTNDLMFELTKPGGGAPMWVEARGRPVRDAHGEVVAGVAVYRDVTERKAQLDANAALAALYKETVASIEDGIALLGPDDEVLLVNRAFGAMFGLTDEHRGRMTRAQFVDHATSLLLDPKNGERLRARGPTVEEFVFARPRRRVLRRRWTALTATGRTVISWHDVTAERDLIAERERLLLVDLLTGIPNRRAAEVALRVEEARKNRASTPLCVALFDIDHFKKVNDTFGHAAGDLVLQRVATTLAGQARMTDTVARWGGEEFLAVLPVPLVGAGAFCERARRAVEALQLPDVGHVTLSVGVAEVAAGEAPSVAIERADQRLYEAKRAGRNRVVAQ